MRSFPMLRVRVSTPKLNLDHMLMALLVAKQVRQLSINQSDSGQAMASSQPTQTPNVLSVQSSDQKVTSNLEGIRKMEKIIVRVGIRTKMLIIMTITLVILGGISRLNVR